MEHHIYNVSLIWKEDRKGVICSPELNRDANSCIEVATPPEFPKGIPGIWSPEHLFTAAVSSCLMTTFLAIAENFKLPFTDFNCKSKGILEQVEASF
jgi:organic hydroperoxide reductase OsmC/OhrA